MKNRSTIFSLTVILVLLVSLMFQVTPSQALAGTYFTTTDNENNAHTGSADGDMDVDIYNDNPLHPIEFNITIPVGGLPTTDAFLTIRAHDVDEEQGQKDEVFLNGTSLGFLSGTDNTWNTSAFAIPAGLLVEGNNLVVINVDTLNPGGAQWLVEIDWGQVVVDGGIGTPARINSITVTGFTVAGGNITLDVDVVIEALADGTFTLETNIYAPTSNNVGANTQTGIVMTAGQILTRPVQFIFPEGANGDIYTIRSFLFDEATGLLNSIKSTTWTYSTVSAVYDLDVSGIYNYMTNDPAMDIATGLTATSNPAGGTLDGAIVVIGAGFQSGDTLAATDSGGVTSSYNSTNGVLTLLGTADVSVYQTVLGTVKFSTSSTNTSARTISYSLGAALPYNSTGHFFEFVPFGTPTWTDSNAAASARTYFGRTGYLATINDAGENDFATTKIGGAGAWVGGSDAATEDTWQWVTGPEAGTTFCISVGVGAGNCVAQPGWYTNWNNLEPNDAGGVEDYMQFLSGGSGQWNDLDGATNATVTGYVVEYGGLGSDTPMDVDGFVTVNVTSNTAPVAVDDPGYSTPHNTLLNGTTVLANDTDAESDPLTAVLNVGPAHAASFTLNSNGTFSYTPTTGYVGADSFTYHANDGLADSNIATASINVTNTAPVADDDSYSTPMDTLLNGSTVLDGDTDANGDPLTAIKVTDPTSGTLTAFNADGTFTYTPAAGFVGQATFTYKANDGSADSNTATVTIDVINTPPTITEGTETTVTMSEDSAPVPFALTLHATDPDGDPLTWSLQTPATYGTASVNATSGVVSYIPYVHYYGNDSFIVTVTDGRAIVPITVNVVVTPVDDPQLGANSFWLIYNNWRNNESAGYFDGNFITSKAGRLILAIPVSKSSLTLVVSKGPDQGMMQVQVDGLTVRNVDLYSATLVKNNNLVISLPVGSRKVTIIATGAKNPASTGTWVRLDSYRFNTDPIINADLNLALWSNFFRAGSRNYRATTQPGNVVLEFKGQVIGWYTYRGPDAGMVDVYVDGVYVQTIDLYNATALWDQVYTFGPYTYGLHTIEFRVLSTKNPLSTGRRVIMDQVDKE